MGWEYRKINLNEAPRRSQDVDMLSAAGAKGWDLVVILANNVAYLKRKLAATTDASPETAAGEEERVSEVKPKYRDPATGETWSGRGRMASWLKRKQDAGEDIEKYRI
jgi:DNA-binding protein H-NS